MAFLLFEKDETFGLVLVHNAFQVEIFQLAIEVKMVNNPEAAHAGTQRTITGVAQMKDAIFIHIDIAEEFVAAIIDESHINDQRIVFQFVTVDTRFASIGFISIAVTRCFRNVFKINAIVQGETLTGGAWNYTSADHIRMTDAVFLQNGICQVSQLITGIIRVTNEDGVLLGEGVAHKKDGQEEEEGFHQDDFSVIKVQKCFES